MTPWLQGSSMMDFYWHFGNEKRRVRRQRSDGGKRSFVGCILSETKGEEERGVRRRDEVRGCYEYNQDGGAYEKISNYIWDTEKMSIYRKGKYSIKIFAYELSLWNLPPFFLFYFFYICTYNSYYPYQYNMGS